MEKDTKADLDKLLVRADVAALATQLYGHVLDCIDFGQLYGLEQQLWHLLAELKLDDDLAKALIQRAIVRAATDPATGSTDVPPGISKAEAKAADFDEGCPFCRYEAAHPHEAEADEEPAHGHGDDACSLCDDLANDWRKQHADALRAGARRLTARSAKRVSS